ncbi:MAG: hypothetical protein HOY76_48970, partial [Streptomyces sp.]|nr:hypothetical protein [Streptomyces sp.]
TGCSSGSGGSKQRDALRHMPAAASAKQVTYLDEARVRKLSASDAKRFSTVGQPASRLLSGYAGAPWGDTLKVSQIDTAIDDGESGTWEGTFDAAAVIAKLKSNGFTSKKEDGKDVLTAEGGSVTVAVSADEVRYSSGGVKFSASDPSEGDSLAGTPEYGQVADCLGDVYRADFNIFAPKEHVRLSALGQQADDSGANTEVLCAVARDRATADSLAAKLRALVKDKPEKYRGATVTTGKGDHPAVRISVPDSSSQRPGRLMISDVEVWMTIGKV